MSAPDRPALLRLRHDHADRAARRVLVVGRVVVGLISLCLALLLGRMVQLQTAPDPRIVAMAGDQVSGYPLLARRGTLMDRRGRALAVTRTGHRLFMDPAIIPDPEAFPLAVAERLGYDPVRLAKLIGANADKRYVVIDALMDPERVEALRGWSLRGLGVQRRLVREYPNASLAGQVLGFVGADGRGLDGQERLLEPMIGGEPGKLRYIRDARRRPLWVDRSGYEPPRSGLNVRLTLDVTIQAVAEQALGAACERFGAASGQLIVLDPRNGQVLAMANYPGFDPSELTESSLAHSRNRCVTDPFEPGSIFKPLVWAWAVEQGWADPREMFDCHQGLWVSQKGRRLRDAHEFDMLSWEEVLMRSSNIGMAQVGLRMGAAELYRGVRAFGIGSPTGSGLAGESAGIVNPLARWNHYSETSVPMGQEVAVTPLQIMRAFTVLAGDGTLVRPTLRLDPNQAPWREPVIDADTALLTRQVLRRAVAEGTGGRADSERWPVFGKTGTAQVPDREKGGYAQGAYVGSFIGGAPVDRPRVLVGCFIHLPDPAKGYYGGTVAAPAVREVIEQTLDYLAEPTAIPPPRLAEAVGQPAVPDARP